MIWEDLIILMGSQEGKYYTKTHSRDAAGQRDVASSATCYRQGSSIRNPVLF